MDRVDRDLRIAIIGAGPGGLCMEIRLKGAGFERFEILEKASGVGGTWYYNRYPGCACDIPSHLYSYSFEIKRDWSRPYAPPAEILAYLEHCAEKWPRSMPALEQALSALDEECYEAATRPRK